MSVTLALIISEYPFWDTFTVFPLLIPNFSSFSEMISISPLEFFECSVFCGIGQHDHCGT
jgi:hypothetical protein